MLGVAQQTSKMALLTWLVSVLSAVAGTVFLLLKRYPWLPLDWRYMRMMGGSMLAYTNYKRKNMQLVDIFEQQVKKFPKKTFLIFQGQHFSYEFVDKQANRVAHLAGKLGLKKGDTACMMMYNEAVFVYVYLGRPIVILYK